MTTSKLDFPSTTTSSGFDISSFDHFPSYCEENVYLLCKKLSKIGAADAEGLDLFVVFVSNQNKQRSRGENTPHQVWDLDSSLSFPSPLTQYVSEAIQPTFQLYPEFQRLFRVVHAPIFLRLFASDRRHMKDSVGNWIAQPPAYEPIVAEDGTVHNLDEYIQFGAADATNAGDGMVNTIFSEKLGVVVSEAQLEDFFNLLS